MGAWILSNMIWLFENMFNILGNILDACNVIITWFIWLLPVIKNLLLIYSFIHLIFILLCKLYNMCRYVVWIKDETVEIVVKEETDINSNEDHKVSIVPLKDENKKHNFKNTRDFWNKNQTINSTQFSSGKEIKITYKKSKTCDVLTMAKCLKNNKIQEWMLPRQNVYGKVKHRTLNDNSQGELSFDDEHPQSDVDSLISKGYSTVTTLEDDDLESLTGDSSFHVDSVDQFSSFAKSTNMGEILQIFSEIKKTCGLPSNSLSFPNIFPIIRDKLQPVIPYRYAELLTHLQRRSECSEYRMNTVGRGKRVLIIGAGPCGLRMAIETQYLGAETTVIETRHYMDRNNVLKLWTFVMEDLKSLGAKKLYPPLGTGTVNHVSIRILQFILLKMCLLLGTQVRIRETFKTVVKPSNGRRWSVRTEVVGEDGIAYEHEEEYDIVICASGRNVPIQGFEKKSLEAKLSIAITANFVNTNTSTERKVEEIPGLSKQYDLEFFKNMENQTGIQLENIVYYKDLTHYFVMTAKKDSLIRKGVIKNFLEDRDNLLAQNNIDREALEAYAIEAAAFATRHFSNELPKSPFARWKNQNDVSIFDFTDLYISQNACRVQQRKGHLLLLGLVGDSLIEPFWPEGTGIGRGFLSVFDTAWLVKKIIEEPTDKVYEVIREREKLYSLLRQTTDAGLKGSYKKWSINPGSRYPTTSFQFNQVGHIS